MKDISGLVFGKLTAIKPFKLNNGGGVLWECKCECGNVVTNVNCSELRRGERISCGKCNRGFNRQDMAIGTQYDYWKIIEGPFKKEDGVFYFKCKCICGTERSKEGRELRSGRHKSCGCKHAEYMYEAAKKKREATGKRDSAFRSVASSYKWSATNKGLAWGLTDDDIFAINQSPCAYCGLPPSNISKAGKNDRYQYVYNGIDRINNDLGYQMDNVAPCCTNCNYMKHNLTKDDFLNHIKRIYEFSFMAR